MRGSGAGQQLFAIAVDNNYLKVIINEQEVTYFHEWLKTSGWRYLAVTVIKNYVDGSAAKEISQSQVKIYLDKTLASSQTISSHFEDVQSGTVSDKIGFNFRGVIKTVRLQSSMFCAALQSPSVSTSKWRSILLTFLLRYSVLGLRYNDLLSVLRCFQPCLPDYLQVRHPG